MRIAITCGDPAGIGPEVVASWLRDHTPGAERYTVFGPDSWLATLPRCEGVGHEAVGPASAEITPGTPTSSGCAAAMDAMEQSARGCASGRFDAVVSGPISKSEMRQAGFAFPGQTEFFAARWGGTPTMAFTGGHLRVALATWHVPLSEVALHLTREVLARTVRHAEWLARAEGCEQPRIAVCGLNPHAGEEGMLGSEEIEKLDPWLTEIAGEVRGVSRCLPADTVFFRALRGEFDVVVALYHDQGLAPLKLVDFDSAVNVTLGLPFVRTSPDHGTAYDIAGKGLARATSFSKAVEVASQLGRFSRFCQDRPS